MTVGHNVRILQRLLSALIGVRGHAAVGLKLAHPLVQRAGRHMLTNTPPKTLNCSLIQRVLSEQRVIEYVGEACGLKKIYL